MSTYKIDEPDMWEVIGPKLDVGDIVIVNDIPLHVSYDEYCNCECNGIDCALGGLGRGLAFAGAELACNQCKPLQCLIDINPDR